MKNIKIILIAILLIAINSCKEDEVNNVNVNDRVYTPEIIKEDYGQARVVGFAKDKAGNPLSNVRVYFGEHESITNGEGKFELTQVSKGSNKRIWFEKEGYARTQKLIDVSEELPNRVDATLFNIEKTAKLNDDGGKIEGDDFSVEIEPGGFVYSDGEIVKGEVTVSVTPFLISEENFINAFPGKFRGTREDGSETAIESYGFIDVDLQDENGEPVQLADGVKAKIQIKAPSNSPSTIPMWYYDFKKAEWIEEGVGTYVNGFYTATVTHFTPWNWDKPVELRAKIIGKVVDNEGNPIEGATLVQTAKSRGFEQSAKSRIDGTFEMFTLENLNVEIEAQFDIYGSVAIDYKTSGSQLNDIGEIVIDVRIENVMFPIILNDILYITMGKVAKIRGNYFGLNKKQGYKLLLNGDEINTISWQNKLIEFDVPKDIPEEGTIQIERANNSIQVNYREGVWTCEINGTTYENDNLPISFNQYRLYLRGRKLKEIPSCIGNLDNLQELELGNNQLIILPETIGNLYNLELLSIDKNKLTNLPESIGNLFNLKDLELYENQLTNLPESIGNLYNLENLFLSKNQLTNLPESISNLYNLKDLELNENQLDGIPENIGSLDKLEELSLSSNFLTTIPNSIGNLINLKFINLDDNKLTTLPGSIGNLINIEWLYLNENQLNSLPESIGNLIKLERLNINENQLYRLPESIGNFVNLRWLYIEENQLTSLPESIGNLIRLERLYLNKNQLSSLPKSIGNLNNLKWLYIKDNQLSSLPESIGNLNKVDWFFLNNNQLTSLPESIGNLNNLKWLILNNNLLTSLPDSFCNLRNLDELYIINNQLKSLPENFGNLNKLENLILTENQIASLPESFGNLYKLKWLSLENNQLTNLPESIKNLKNTLSSISLKGNPIPESERAKIESWLPNTKIIWE